MSALRKKCFEVTRGDNIQSVDFNYLSLIDIAIPEPN